MTARYRETETLHQGNRTRVARAVDPDGRAVLRVVGFHSEGVPQLATEDPGAVALSGEPLRHRSAHFGRSPLCLS